MKFYGTYLRWRPSLAMSLHTALQLKVGLSPGNKFVICLIESPLKMMKSLKAFFVLKIFKFLSRHFGHAVKTA